MYNITIIGAGQIGSRHLQALKLIEKEISIFVVDPNKDSLVLAEKRFNQVEGKNNVKSIIFTMDLNEIDEDQDIVIIATNSNVRRSVIEELISAKKTKYLILEKVLFQAIDDYKIIEKYLLKNNIKAWINCTRRSIDFYNDLKRILKADEIEEVFVQGSNWGLGSNSIHYIDLVAFLTGNTKYEVKSVNIVQNKSKRIGFSDFNGTIIIKFSNGTILNLSSYPIGNIPSSILIVANKNKFLIDESKGNLLSSSNNDNWEWKMNPFQVSYQSQLTHKIVGEILDTGNSKLTPYKESANLHLPFIEAIIQNMEKSYKGGKLVCPIT